MEYLRFEHYARMRFGAWEAVHNHFIVGRVDAQTWELWNAFYLDRLDRPGYRRVWQEIGPGYDAGFRRILAAEYLRE